MLRLPNQLAGQENRHPPCLVPALHSPPEVLRPCGWAACQAGPQPAPHLAAAADDGLGIEGGDAAARRAGSGDGAARRLPAVEVQPTEGVGAGQHVDVGGAATAAGAVELVGAEVDAEVGVAVVGCGRGWGEERREKVGVGWSGRPHHDMHEEGMGDRVA